MQGHFLGLVGCLFRLRDRSVRYWNHIRGNGDLTFVFEEGIVFLLYSNRKQKCTISNNIHCPLLLAVRCRFQPRQNALTFHKKKPSGEWLIAMKSFSNTVSKLPTTLWFGFRCIEISFLLAWGGTSLMDYRLFINTTAILSSKIMLSVFYSVRTRNALLLLCFVYHVCLLTILFVSRFFLLC